MEDTRLIGSVNAKFKSFQWFHIPMSNSIADRAYNELMREAKRLYVGKNVDVVNIRISGTMSGGTIATLLLFWPLIVFGNGQIITALGDVILLDGSLPDRPERTPVKTYAAQTEIDKPKGLEDAIKKVSSIVMTELPNGSKIAVMSITADNEKISALVLDEVEYNFVSAKRFTIVDRSTLDLIRKEHLIQTDGAFDDATLVKLGKLSGANVVIAGSVIKSGNTNRFSLKAMSVQTGQIITMARESY
jgi:hypothetical protein